jgi:circadian clock protein KaiB
MRKAKQVQNEYAAFDRALKESDEQVYLLRLYITGATPKSLRAIENLKRLCDENLKGRCRLEVIDVYQQPVLAKGEQIIAVPTLIKYLPKPLRRFIGSMAETDRILLGLDLQSTGDRKRDKQ